MPPQYNQQSIYVVSPNQNQMQIKIQQTPLQHQPQPPPVPHHQAPIQNGGPIYVASSAASAISVLPNSLSNSSSLYTGQINSPMQAACVAVSYGPTNGATGGYGSPNQAQHSGVPMPPQMPPLAPPPPPNLMLAGPIDNEPPSHPPAPPKPPATIISGLGTTAAPPPPPPPPGMLSSKTDEPEINSLAAQLQMAKLKRSQKAAQVQPVENSGSSTSSGGSANYGTIGRLFKPFF
jgi:hypothetical protein